MGFGKVLRQRVPIIGFLVEFQKTVWYPILFAVLCVISGTHGYNVYLPIMWILCAFVVFSVIFTDDNKVFITPLFIMYLAIGFDKLPSSFVSSNGNMLAVFDKKAFVGIIVCATVAIGAFFVRLIADGSVASAFKKRGGLTRSILALDTAFLLNGLFGANYSIKNLLYGAIMAFGLTASYFLIGGMLERSENVLLYACKVSVCTSYTVLFQIAWLLCENYLNGTLIYKAYNLIIKDNLNLGWGVSTVICAVLVLGIPSAFYMAKNCKLPYLSCISATLFLGGAIMMDCRSAVFIGLAVLAVCTVITCISGKNRVHCRIYTVLLIIAIAITVVYFISHPDILPDEIERILKTILKSHKGFSGREKLWKNGIEDFLSSPVFGIGFNDGGYLEDANLNVYSNMYHCIGIEFLGATGIFGCLAFLFHIVQLMILLFKKISWDKLLIIMVPAMILGMSLVDNFFFYFNFQIFYGAFLVFTEIYNNEKTVPSEKKTITCDSVADRS